MNKHTTHLVYRAGFTLLATLTLAACTTQTNVQLPDDAIETARSSATLSPQQHPVFTNASEAEKLESKTNSGNISDSQPATLSLDKRAAVESDQGVTDQRHEPNKPGFPHRQKTLAMSSHANSALKEQYAHPQHRRIDRYASPAPDRENYQHFEDNHLKLVTESPVSTFSVDVDTASYANVRRMLNSGRMPGRDAVRIEELINYFNYDYPAPDNLSHPFSINTELAPSPWNENTYLMQVGLKGYEKNQDTLPPANLVFLLDVSGSMQSVNKLPLLKQSLKLLLQKLRKQDRVSIVVYAGASGTVLDPTPGNHKQTIQRALDNLQAGGSTNGAAGIDLAYQVAESAFIENGINRILLCTDGDFNVGTTDFNSLIQLVETKRKTGIALSTFGFGTGNLNDHLAEQLANRGNGVYSYIDSLKEAQKVLHQQMTSSILTIAKDVKIQIEFNPEKVSHYRLIGYVNRKLAREDFNNDKVDAGDIGAGHTVTALYEIGLTDGENAPIDPLRYKQTIKPRHQDQSESELAFVKLRYKQPDSTKSKLLSYPVSLTMLNTEKSEMSERMKFSASVAAFGQRLRGGKYLQDYSWKDILQLARQGRGKDENGYRGEFIQLINLASSLDQSSPLANLE